MTRGPAGTHIPTGARLLPGKEGELRSSRRCGELAGRAVCWAAFRRRPAHAGVGQPLQLRARCVRADRRRAGPLRPSARSRRRRNGTTRRSPPPRARRRRRRAGRRRGSRRNPVSAAARAGRGRRSRRPDEPDQDRLVDEIDRQAVPAGEGDRPRRRRLRPPAVGPRQPGEHARQPRDAEAEQARPRPRAEAGASRACSAAPRRGRATAAPADRTTVDWTSNGARSPPRRQRDSPTPAPSSNGRASRLAAAMQCRMPNQMRSPGAKTKLPTVTSAAAPRDDREALAQKARRFSPLRWASASDTPTSARNVLAIACDRSRIGGVNGSIGETSPKSARSQLKW